MSAFASGLPGDEHPGPLCACTPDHEDRGTYDPDCLVHEPWRCTVPGCPEVAVQAHVCVLHERRLA